MKTTTLFAATLAAAFSFSSALAQKEEKTLGEKTSEAWEKTKETTMDVTNTVVKKTKEAVKAVEHKIDNPDADANKVAVTITDKGVQMPRSLPDGKTAFIVTNSGKEKHNFEIQGENLEKSFWFGIDPKGSKTMQVNLKPGTYEAECNVDEHVGKESKVKLTVK